MSDTDVAPEYASPVVDEPVTEEQAAPLDTGIPGVDPAEPTTPVAEQEDEGLVLMRATISMSGGVTAGLVYRVDPRYAFVRDAISNGYFVPPEGD